MSENTRSILWRRVRDPGMDRCELTTGPDGHRLSGTALFSGNGLPVEIRYSIALDERWRTRIVGVHVRAPADVRSVALRSDGEGNWEVGGEPIDDLAGATDVDLAWTPATNTIPIRRLDLDVGAGAETLVAFVPYPDRLVERRAQSYTRLAERRYRYQSGDFSTDLTVDAAGIVTQYPGMWTGEASG
jgi:hypothetical protein